MRFLSQNEEREDQFNSLNFDLNLVENNECKQSGEDVKLISSQQYNLYIFPSNTPSRNEAPFHFSLFRFFWKSYMHIKQLY